MKQAFTYGPDGELLHSINDELRAVVQAEHVEDYCIEIGVELPPAPESPAELPAADGAQTD